MTDPLAGRQIGAWCLTLRHGNNTAEFSTLDHNWTVSKTESGTAYSYYRTGDNDKITNLYCLQESVTLASKLVDLVSSFESASVNIVDC